VFLSFLDLVDVLRLRGRVPFVESDKCGAPIRLYPFYPGCDSARHIIAIDPRIAFGRPIILRAGITTRAISKRIEAGEADMEVAADYGLTREEIRQALLFEGAA
jgi:uncharacterized protein (DUF433 family)